MEYLRCVCVWIGAKWVEIGLGLGFTNRVGTGGVLDVCLCLGCSGVGDADGEWVGDLDQGLEEWTGVMYV